MDVEDPLDDIRLDRSQFSIARLTDPDDSLQYWLSRPVSERLQALEQLRRISYGHNYAEQGLQRILEVVQLEWR